MNTDQERWHCNECGHDFIRGDASSVEVGDSLEHVIACPVCLANEWDTPGALTMIETMDTPTPETDALELQLYQTQPDAGTVERMRLALCRKLERERNQARREAEASWDCKWPKPSWSWLAKGSE
jgi:hypothetical protein